MIYCWICGRPLPGKANTHHIMIREMSLPVCADEITCAEIGNYYRVENAEDEVLIAAFIEHHIPLPARLENTARHRKAIEDLQRKII